MLKSSLNVKSCAINFAWFYFYDKGRHEKKIYLHFNKSLTLNLIMMKKLLSMAAIALVGIALSCQSEDDNLATSTEISDVTLSKIAALGFSTAEVQSVDGGYLVEGDIMLRDKDLNSVPSSTLLRIAEVEQYHTFNLVSTPRVITVSGSGSINAAISNAIDGAIARYNAQNLSITFSRVASNGNINVRIVSGGSYIASSGFPSGGNPYNEVKFNKQYQNYSAGFLTTVLAHEMGHCIGFRHTDYMNRTYSCGTGGNEGQETTGVGAVYIPGTATGPEAASWMLACLSSTTDRPFNANDKTALNYLY